MKRILLLCAVVFCLAGCTCTTVEVKPLAADPQLKEISLIDNPKVIVRDFVPVLEKRLADHGIGLKPVPESAKPGPEEYNIRYSAERSWMGVPYLSDAYVNIYKGNRLVAYAKYHVIGGSLCLSVYKWQGTETKMNPIYAELLKHFPAAK